MQRLRTLHHALSPKLNRFVNICIIAALLAAACTSLQQPARALAQVTETCTASMDGAWESEFIWLCDGISTFPNSDTNVVIPTGVNVTAADPTGVLPEFTAYDLTVEQNAFLRLQDNGELQVSGKIDLYGSLLMDGGGTLAAVNPAAVTSLYSTSTLSLTGGSTMTTAGEMIMLNGGMYAVGGNSFLSTAGGLNLQGRLDGNASIIKTENSAPLTVNPTGILVIDTGSTLDSTGDLVVNGELDVNPGATVNLSGDLDVSGSLYASSGVFVLASGLNQTIDARSKSLSLGTLRKQASAPGETLSFTPGGSLMVNTLDLTGTEANPLLLRSTVSGSQFGLTVPSEGSQTLDYVDVKDASAQPFTLYPLHWTDSGNNTNWQQGYLATTTTVTATPASATSSFGTALTYSVEVTSASGTPTGYVSLTENGVSYGQALLDGSGAAAITTATLPVGVHASLVAHYNGGGLFGSSEAAIAAVQTVTKSTASLDLTAPGVSVYGEPVTLSASVTSPDGGVITGQVTFFDGVESLGPVALDETGSATMMLSPAAGEHTFTARYSGSANYTTAEDTTAVSVNAPDHLFTVQSMSSDSSDGSCTEGTCTNCARPLTPPTRSPTRQLPSPS